MARGLKLEMVAEGVEEECQLRYLQELNCPVIQGFYYSQAVPCEEARQLIKDGASIIGSKPLQNNESHKSSFAGKNKLKATAG
jgi:predicted signal transduction protein with EAL and GGDEF domain